MSVNLVKQWFPQFLTALDRAPMAGLLCAAALLFGVTLAWTRSAAAPNRTSAELDSGVLSRTNDPEDKSIGNDQTNRLREGGEIINQAGYFRTAGNRVAFVSADNKNQFITLENHNMERIAQAIADNSNQSQWIVSGMISEYRGANFLLVSRAELKPQIRSSNASQ